MPIQDASPVTLDDLLDRHFGAAVAATRNIDSDSLFQPNPQQRFLCYGLYKQATVGPCNIKYIDGNDSIAAWKHQAWSLQGQKSKRAAKFEYICSMFSILTGRDDDMPPAQRAFINGFVGDVKYLRALRVDEEGCLQTVDPTLVVMEAPRYTEPPVKSIMSTQNTAPASSAPESHVKSQPNSPQSYRLLTAFLLRVMVWLQSVAVVICPVKYQPRVHDFIGTTVDFILAMVHLLINAVGLWPKDAEAVKQTSWVKSSEKQTSQTLAPPPNNLQMPTGKFNILSGPPSPVMSSKNKSH